MDGTNSGLSASDIALMTGNNGLGGNGLGWHDLDLCSAHAC